MSQRQILDIEPEQETQIKVVGVGGGGGNAVEHMINSDVQGVEFICANTDAQALRRSSAHRLIRLGSSGLGAGSTPEKGRVAAEEASDEIKAALKGAHMVFITAGMGGGTGTGAAPVIARIAREMGILTVAVVTRPFEWEGGRRISNAEGGLENLSANVDSMIVVLNEKLIEVFGDDITQEEAFAKANDVLRSAVGGIADIINVPGHVNVDFEDVRTVMSEPGKATMGTAVASGPDRARIAAEQAVACPLLKGVSLSGAKGVLVLVTAARGTLKLSESKIATETVRAFASQDAHVIYGTAYDDSLGDQIRVTVVASGLQARSNGRPILRTVETPALRTGTDDLPAAVQPGMNPADIVNYEIPTVLRTPAKQFAQGLSGFGAAASRPNVWRQSPNRVSAAAKIDALSAGGMDDVEIPAFLRKQAD